MEINNVQNSHSNLYCLLNAIIELPRKQNQGLLTKLFLNLVSLIFYIYYHSIVILK